MDIDTTLPAHREGKPTMQLELPTPDDVMMEIDQDNASRPAALDSNHLSSPQSNPTFSAHSTSPSHLSPNSKPLESTAQPFRPIPPPPVVLVSSSDLPAWPKFKLDQLFVEWLSRPTSKSWLDSLLEEATSGTISASFLQEHEARAKSDRSPSPGARSPTSSQISVTPAPQQAPSSPVSRLFSKHIPFGDGDSSPRSPNLAPSGSNSRHPLGPLLVGDLDLGKSGSASPLLPDQISTAEDSSKTHRRPRQVSTSDALPSKTQDAISLQRDVESEVVQTATAEPQQVPDSKALDKVADGIAGMSAILEPKGDDIAKMNVESTTPPSAKSDQHMQLESDEALKDPLPVEPMSQPRRDIPSLQEKSEKRALPQLESSEKSSQPVVLKPSKASDELKEPGKSVSFAQRDVREVIAPKSATVASSEDTETPTSFDAIPIDTFGQPVKKETQKLVSAAIPPAPPKLSTTEDATMVDSTLQRAKRKGIPRFYFPCGREAEKRERQERERIQEYFGHLKSQKRVAGVSRTDIAELVVDVISLPSYFGSIVFNAIQLLFGGSTAVANGEQQKRATSSDMKSEEVETTMNDMSDRNQTASARTKSNTASITVEAGHSNSHMNKSDTTMGELKAGVDCDSNTNGFRAGSSGQRESSHQQARNRATVADGSIPLSTGASREFVNEEQFMAYYDTRCAGYSKEARLFNALLEPGATRNYLIPNDFKPLLRALLTCHQGLAFLHSTPEFQQRYSETVIERIYFGCTRQHNGRLTLQDIRRSKLLDTLMVVDEEEDINKERRYFSYEHFYVLYCRFWELDANHDLQIDREDLMRYGSHSLTYRIVDRIFGGFARPLDTPENPGYMSYTDFIWFCLSEEDKTSETAIDYWFRCVDMDGDGLITMYDMEFFYKEQLHRMECFGHEPVQIRDILCQLLDMIKPNVQPPVIRRRDLKRCRLAGNFFNVLFNLNKFFAIEARDPLQIRQEHATPELTDWDRFAALEYLRLSAEEEGEEDEGWEEVGDSANPLMAGEAPF